MHTVKFLIKGVRSEELPRVQEVKNCTKIQRKAALFSFKKNQKNTRGIWDIFARYFFYPVICGLFVFLCVGLTARWEKSQLIWTPATRRPSKRTNYCAFSLQPLEINKQTNAILKYKKENTKMIRLAGVLCCHRCTEVIFISPRGERCESLAF